MRSAIALTCCAALAGCGSDPHRLAQLEERVAKLEQATANASAGSEPSIAAELRGDFLWFEYTGQDIANAGTGWIKPERWYEVIREGDRIVKHGYWHHPRFGNGHYDHDQKVGQWVQGGLDVFNDTGERIAFHRAEGRYRDDKRVGDWRIFADRAGQQLLGTLTYEADEITAFKDPAGATVWER